MKNFSPISRKRRGFTLVEILVVIGIIALLAGIAFPVFSRARESARRSTCQSNLKQLGLAFAQYQQDYKRYPFPGNHQRWANGGDWIKGGENGVPTNYLTPPGNPGAVENKGLADITAPFAYVSPHEAYPEQGALFPYVKEKSIYICPSAPDNEKKKVSYSMNCAVAVLSDVRIRTPSQIVLLVDEGETINDGYFWAHSSSAGSDALMKKHNGGGNLLFVDGHVKFFPFDSFPLDNSTPGNPNKVSLTNPVRFLDPAFGPRGANVPAPSSPPVTPIKDWCGTETS